jgi:hypothetical protein
MRLVVALGLAVALAGASSAKVENSGPSGFTLAYETDLAIPPKDAYDRWLRIAEWWSSDHTYSGNAKNLSIEAAPAGCWCETLADGGFVVHMRVAYAQPGQALLFSGGLGPLAYMGVSGSMSVEFKAADMAGTHVTLRYAVGGYDPANFSKLPPLVDGVLNEGFERYKAFAAEP